MEDKKTITIEVCRGIIEGVYNLPKNYDYQIIENDNYELDINNLINKQTKKARENK